MKFDMLHNYLRIINTVMFCYAIAEFRGGFIVAVNQATRFPPFFVLSHNVIALTPMHMFIKLKNTFYIYSRNKKICKQYMC